VLWRASVRDSSPYFVPILALPLLKLVQQPFLVLQLTQAEPQAVAVTGFLQSVGPARRFEAVRRLSSLGARLNMLDP
jgi:hypothetical protein